MTAVRAQLSTDERRDGDQTSACDHILGVLWHSLAAQNNGSARSNTCTQRRRRRVVRLVARRGGRRAAHDGTDGPVAGLRAVTLALSRPCWMFDGMGRGRWAAAGAGAGAGAGPCGGDWGGWVHLRGRTDGTRHAPHCGKRSFSVGPARPGAAAADASASRAQLSENRRCVA